MNHQTKPQLGRSSQMQSFGESKNGNETLTTCSLSTSGALVLYRHSSIRTSAPHHTYARRPVESMVPLSCL